MKKISLKPSKVKMIIALISFVSLAINCKAQITLDTILSPADLKYFFKPVQISDTETKYYLADTITNTFDLYNLDFTPFLMNVAVPEPFIQTSNPLPSIFTAIYITRSLFDCDTSNIEYAYECGDHSYETFYIMRTDGTQLFRLDSANGPYCYGCFGASDIVRPIRKTSEGYKMFLQREWGGVQIYSLCGTLPDQIFEFNNDYKSYVTLFPNPSMHSLTFEIDSPSNEEPLDLVIIDTNAKEIKRENINYGKNSYLIDIREMSSGTYIYSLCTKSHLYQSGKFIINK